MHLRRLNGALSPSFYLALPWALALCILSAPSGAEANPGQALSPVAGERCLTPPMTPAEIRAVDWEARIRLQMSPSFTQPEMDPVTIPVAFHIIMNDAGTLGRVSDTQLDEQMRVINEAFASCGLTFEIAEVNRYNDEACFKLSLANEGRCKPDRQVDPFTHLNFYTASLRGSSLGWAWFPWTMPVTAPRDGIVVDYRAMPGGAEPYDLGETGTHEVGHWVGLYHTFEGGCSTQGDRVDDTPAQESAIYGCAVGSDTCPQPGEDPIRNTMGYSDDACVEGFTSGQCTRADSMLRAFRPELFE